MSAPPREPPGSPRPRWALPVRSGVTAALVALVVSRVDVGAAFALLRATSPCALGLVAAVTVLSMVLWALRWQRILTHLGERVGFAAVFRELSIGITFNLALPTSVGGDFVRAHRLAPQLRQGAHAWASVLFERVVGLFALVLLSTVGLSFWADPGALLPAVVGLGALLAGLALLGARPLRALARRLGPRFSRLATALEGVAAALDGPLGRSAVRAETLVFSLAFQGIALSLLVPAAWPFLDPAALLGIYLGVPIALVATLLPVSIGGLGLREGMFVVVLAPFGVSAERALFLALVWLASSLLIGLPGLFLFLRGAR